MLRNNDHNSQDTEDTKMDILKPRISFDNRYTRNPREYPSTCALILFWDFGDI